MRFSIQPGGFGKYAAIVGGRKITIYQDLFSTITFSAKWRWMWPDGTWMQVSQHCHQPWHVSVGSEIVSSGEESRLAWICGESRLLYKNSYRRLRTWREMFSAKSCHVLELENGAGVAAWKGNSQQVFEGVIRRSVSDDLVRAVFGIIICLYVTDD
jgi:hypothetical protein